MCVETILQVSLVSITTSCSKIMLNYSGRSVRTDCTTDAQVAYNTRGGTGPSLVLYTVRTTT